MFSWEATFYTIYLVDIRSTHDQPHSWQPDYSLFHRGGLELIEFSLFTNLVLLLHMQKDDTCIKYGPYILIIILILYFMTFFSFTQNDGLIVVGATNRVDNLDK